MTELPTWRGPRGGSGCDNEDCTAGQQHCRVLSREEIERVYRDPEKLPGWPLPEQYTHMCTRCGQGYAGYEEPASLGHSDDSDGVDVPLEEWDHDDEALYDSTVRDATEAFVTGAPDHVSAKQIVEGVLRHVPGAGRRLARDVIEESSVDATLDTADEFL